MQSASENMKNGLYISIDWIGFTVKKDMSINEILKTFGLNPQDFADGLNGSYGYKSRMRHSEQGISVLYDGLENMGVHIDVSGSAIRYFLESYRNKSICYNVPFGGVGYEVNNLDMTLLSNVLKDIMDIGHLTRLDIPIDDKGCNYFKMDELVEIFNSYSYVSRFKKYTIYFEDGKSDKIERGTTIRVGSRTSPIMLRIYDKKAEQNKKFNENIITEDWTRWEIELHKERANAVALMIINGASLSNIAIGVLSNYIRLINKDSDRSARCSTNEKWELFLCGISKIKIYHDDTEKSIEDKSNWVAKQVAPTLSALYELFGIDYLYYLIEIGMCRQKEYLKGLVKKEIAKLENVYRNVV